MCTHFKLFCLFICLFILNLPYLFNEKSGSRVIVAAAGSNFFPKYSEELRTWHKHYQTPICALFAQFVWCTLIVLFVGSSFTITSFMLFSTFAMYSYWIFYLATGIGLLLIRRRERLGILSVDDEPGENTNEKLFKVPLPIAGIFILAGLYILTFSFMVDDNCPGLDAQKCRVQRMAPLFISYGFLFIALLLYYWWKIMLFG